MRSAWLDELPNHLVVGTSSFSWDEWTGVFYPPGLSAGDRIAFYATQFPAVEIDATFYAMPRAAMVANWARKTPDGFRFALKAPQAITHERQLVGTDTLTAEFLAVTAALGPRRGPLVLQFPYHAKAADAAEYRHGTAFRERLAAWLERWAGHGDWVVEVRNRTWLESGLLDLLRAWRVPLALTAYTTMPSLSQLQRDGVDALTGEFAYVRFLCDRRQLDAALAEKVAAGEKGPGFDALILDREPALRGWVEALLPVVTRMRTWCFFNNHYAGFGPGSARLFSRLWHQIHP